MFIRELPSALIGAYRGLIFDGAMAPILSAAGFTTTLSAQPPAVEGGTLKCN